MPAYKRQRDSEIDRAIGLRERTAGLGLDVSTADGRAAHADVLEMAAAAVPGSSFKGKGDHYVSEAELVDVARIALAEVAATQRGVVGTIESAYVDPTARPEVREIAAHTYVVHLADRTNITIRVSVAPLEHQTVAKSVLNLTKKGVTKVDAGAQQVRVEPIEGRYVIQLSNKLDPVHVRRAVSHEVAEILARRELHLDGKIPGRDVLRPQGDFTAPLSPHDRGRLAEIVELARDIASADPSAQERGRHELMALADDMGLRAGTSGADARFELIAPELPAPARDELAKARVHDAALTEAGGNTLARIREEAEADRKAQAHYDQAHKPVLEMPTTGKRRKVTPAERQDLTARASAARTRSSAETVSAICADNAWGVHPKMKLQIGGNAALAAREPHGLLVDANRRWALDRSERLAQTAQQLEPIKAAGIGDPYEFADSGERVPMEAIQFWQDSIAAQGPIINGHAELGLSADGKLIATIHPNVSSKALTVEVEGVPLVSTGFTHEHAPGARGPSPRKAISQIDQALAGLANDPQVREMAEQARAKLAKLPGKGEADAVQALEAIPDRLRARLAMQKELAPALGVLDANASFARLRANNPGHVFYGDEANQLSDAQIAMMEKVVIAGPGGTGVSAAEIILTKNERAHVAMVGKDPPAGLAENDQLRDVVAKHGTKELCAAMHVKPGGVDGRFTLHDGYFLGTPKLADGKYDVGAIPAGRDKAPLAPEHARGDTYISALGRFNDMPPPVASLVASAERAGATVKHKILMDADDFYTGYRVTLENPDRTQHSIDVTGAASRYVDERALASEDQDKVSKSNPHDAPPESGLFGGSYAASARQAARYAAQRRIERYS